LTARNERWHRTYQHILKCVAVAGSERIGRVSPDQVSKSKDNFGMEAAMIEQQSSGKI